jgi:hypothetical protein
VRSRKQIAISISQHVREIDNIIEINEEDQINNSQIKYHKKEIIKQIRSKTQFCTAARMYLQ